jgi:HlyD family secretion protein
MENNSGDIEKISEKGLRKALNKVRKTKKRTKIILGLVLIVVLVIVGFIVFRKKSPTYELTEVIISDIVEDVSSNGTVEAADDIELKFKNAGTIENISVKVGDKVKKGIVLARLESGEIYSQYLQAQASYNQAKAKLDQLLAGATNEEVKVYEQVLENAKISLDDIRDKAENDLQDDYNTALVYLIDASSKYNKALADLKDTEKVYFYYSTSLETTFRSKRAEAEDAFWGVSSLGIKGAKDFIDEAVNDPTQENIDFALLETRSALVEVIDILDYTKTAMADPTIRENVSSTDRTTIDTDIGYNNIAYSNINTAQSNISSQKITNRVNINTAESAYNKAKVDLDEIKAAPRDVDIAVYQADVEKYKANTEEYSQKLKDNSVIAPFDGTVTKTDGKIGEIVSANSKNVVSLISPNNFQIEADISEADIGKINLENPVKITLDAFAEEEWEGTVVEADTGKTVIDGVVYYRIKVLFDKIDPRLKSGMSADILIQTAKKDKVLIVPQRAVVNKNGKRFVRILDNNKIKEIEVGTGLKGNKGEVEITFGLKEKDKAVLYLKNSQK